jgi:archaellum component FlaG (FlaF/FlaG flagellin family)
MKKTALIFTAMIAMALSSCGPHMYKTQSSGKDNISYVIVVADNNMHYNKSAMNVDVIVDGEAYPYDNLYKIKAKRKAHPIIIEPGKHNIKVVVNGEVFTDENVFLSLQETKMIVLR